MPRPDPARRYLMPAIAGYEPGTAGTWYHDVREDATEPILTGREQTGIPKVYADITDLEARNGSGFAARATLFAGRARALR